MNMAVPQISSRPLISAMGNMASDLSGVSEVKLLLETEFLSFKSRPKGF